MIESLRFTVSEAEDSRQALAACARAMPDLILLDWNMPIMGGIEFLTELRSTDGGEKPKVLFCTTERDMGSIRSGYATGADEYLVNPFDQQTLETELRQIGV